MKIDEKKEFLTDEKIKDFIKKLASGSPAPGGGAASALTGAEGVALLIMVTNFTIGRDRYREFEEDNLMMREKANEILSEFLLGIDKDKEAYYKLSEAFKMPKNTEEEKKLRRNEISKEAISAGLAPLRIMEIGVNGLKIAKGLIKKSNPNLIDDVYVGAIHLKASIDGAGRNVDANIPFIDDENKAEEIKEKCKKYKDEAEMLFKDIIAEQK